ncbi:hypothetical protein, partial [Mesorhizobium sp. M2D.F.Ca.ET.140.01.1.1]|uniref:hypothetical protein n=1 Tax=Mesorhizobium sp. M2D.F.Ca.ET.140.01.1.1 TaxID=2496664 RepID=UPI001AECC3EE
LVEDFRTGRLTKFSLSGNFFMVVRLNAYGALFFDFLDNGVAQPDEVGTDLSSFDAVKREAAR